MSKVEVRNLRGTQLMGVARNHALIFDKTAEGGGTGLGINASELFLFSLGACMTFNLLQLGLQKKIGPSAFTSMIE